MNIDYDNYKASLLSFFSEAIYRMNIHKNCKEKINLLTSSDFNVFHLFYMDEPKLSDIDRLVDLLPLARRNYYHPQMKGSWSLKTILPTIAPELDYERLDEVQEGTTAQLAYIEAIDSSMTPARRQELTEKLLAYCQMDTVVLVRLSWFFQQRIG